MADQKNQQPDPRQRGRESMDDGCGPRGRGRGWSIHPVYELLVLGELMIQPMYGYQLHEVANKALGPFHALSWGTLYPLIWRLERQGLTFSETEQRHRHFLHGPRGQPRRIYHLTEAGKQRFFALMLAPGEYNRDYADLFSIKLMKFGFLAPDQQRTVLQQYQGYLQTLRDYYQHGCEEVAHLPGILASERPHILQLFDYKMHSLDADLAWLEENIARLEEESSEKSSNKQATER